MCETAHTIKPCSLIVNHTSNGGQYRKPESMAVSESTLRETAVCSGVSVYDRDRITITQR